MQVLGSESIRASFLCLPVLLVYFILRNKFLFYFLRKLRNQPYRQLITIQVTVSWLHSLRLDLELGKVKECWLSFLNLGSHLININSKGGWCGLRKKWKKTDNRFRVLFWGDKIV